KLTSLSGGEKIITILVDGNHFGGSAEGNKRWYKEKKLEELFGLLRDAGDSLEMIHPGKLLRQCPPRRRAYFPCGSRTELVKSFLAPEERAAYEAAVRNPRGGREKRGMVFPGGVSRRFLVRYPESNALYAKMQYTHSLVKEIRGDKYRKSAAQEELWKAQQNFAYWPSPRFGGIYRNALRKKAYQALISAEKLTRQQGVFIPSIVTADFDLDRRTEYLFQGNQINAYVHTLGARLFELDYIPAAWNYLDTFSRAAENGEAADFYTRRAFIDHFFPAELTLDGFEKLDFPRDCCWGNAPFELIKCDRERGELVLGYTGEVSAGGAKARLKIVKRFVFKGSQINLYYTLTNEGSAEVSLVFASEINFSFLSRKADDLKIFRIKDESHIPVTTEKTALKEASVLVFEDFRNNASLTLSSLEPAELWSLPVETNFPVEEGEAVVYQSTCILPRWKIVLAPEASWENRLNIRIETR
ncbi:MAG: DUF1926 domain-containing protein, partial [Spirochaetaceae bacterium]|nr:DUF1926 domain-containing protein [Spirochaetaceae bacterium]